MARNERRTRNEAGFSLIEVMIAFTILAFGLMTATVGQISAFKTSRQSRSQILAMYLAEQQLETIQSMSATDVKALPGVVGYPDDPNNPIDPDPGDGATMAFDRRWFITPDSPEVGVIGVTIEVDWVDPLGFTRTTSLQSIKADL